MQPLDGRHIAVPETRQLDVLAGLLERRGATVLRCPLISIHDTDDCEHVHCWLDSFIRDPFDDFILLTGEGLRRLVGFAERYGWRDDFIAALAQTRTIARGPKPTRELRVLGLDVGLQTTTPTTQGVIDLLSGESLYDRRIGVQLYGDEDNPLLRSFLDGSGAREFYVKPYRYADAAENQQVDGMIDLVADGSIDALMITSTPQIRRIESRLKSHPKAEAFLSALRANHTLVVSVGPTVSAELERRGWPVDLMPSDSFFMKPMVQALVDHWARP